MLLQVPAPRLWRGIRCDVEGVYMRVVLVMRSSNMVLHNIVWWKPEAPVFLHKPQQMMMGIG